MDISTGCLKKVYKFDQAWLKRQCQKFSDFSSSLLPLRSGAPVYRVKDESLPYLYFDNRYRKTLNTLENIHREIILEKFHGNLTLPGRVDSILEAVVLDVVEIVSMMT